MRDADGHNVEAAYGFANTLVRYLADAQPSHVACCFDHALEGLRHERFPGYKASRGEPPPELERPVRPVRGGVSCAGGARLRGAGLRGADDVIATLAARASRGRTHPRGERRQGSRPARPPGTRASELYDLARDRLFDAESVRAKFGVSPDQIPDYLALVGDAVDDLPGVPGVGPKSAAAALRVFGSLDGMPAPGNLWEEVAVRGARRLGERIAAHRDQALEIRALATVERAVPGSTRASPTWAWHGAEAAKVDPLFGALGWGRIATRIRAGPDRGFPGQGAKPRGVPSAGGRNPVIMLPDRSTPRKRNREDSHGDLEHRGLVLPAPVGSTSSPESPGSAFIYFNFIQTPFLATELGGQAKSAMTRGLVPSALWWFRWGRDVSPSCRGGLIVLTKARPSRASCLSPVPI